MKLHLTTNLNVNTKQADAKNSDTRTYWTKVAKKTLLNKKIVDVFYMTEEDAEKMGWYSCPVVFVLDDGTQIIPSADDEGNDGGSLFYGADGVLPVL